MKVRSLKILAIGFTVTCGVGLAILTSRSSIWSNFVLGESVRVVADEVVTAPLQKADCLVKIYNQSAVEQEIVGIRTSCSCTTTITQFPFKIQPRAFEEVVMLVTTNQHLGKRDYRIEFYMGDGTIVHGNLAVVSQ